MSTIPAPPARLRSRRPVARGVAVLAALVLVTACGGGDGATAEPTGITGSDLMVRGFDNTTAEEQAGLCDGVALMGADFVIDSLLSEDDVPDDIAEADPELMADALAEFCAGVDPGDPTQGQGEADSEG